MWVVLNLSPRFGLVFVNSRTITFTFIRFGYEIFMPFVVAPWKHSGISNSQERGSERDRPNMGKRFSCVNVLLYRDVIAAHELAFVTFGVLVDEKLLGNIENHWIYVTVIGHTIIRASERPSKSGKNVESPSTKFFTKNFRKNQTLKHVEVKVSAFSNKQNISLAPMWNWLSCYSVHDSTQFGNCYICRFVWCHVLCPSADEYGAVWIVMSTATQADCWKYRIYNIQHL